MKMTGSFLTDSRPLLKESSQRKESVIYLVPSASSFVFPLDEEREQPNLSVAMQGGSWPDETPELYLHPFMSHHPLLGILC